MALSCYVLQNAIAGAVCYGWGAGLARHLDGTTLVPAMVTLYLAITAVLILFSRVWLSRFERGPLEWLWHRSHDRITASADRRRPPERVGAPR